MSGLRINIRFYKKIFTFQKYFSTINTCDFSSNSKVWTSTFATDGTFGTFKTIGTSETFRTSETLRTFGGI